MKPLNTYDNEWSIILNNTMVTVSIAGQGDYSRMVMFLHEQSPKDKMLYDTIFRPNEPRKGLTSFLDPNESGPLTKQKIQIASLIMFG